MSNSTTNQDLISFSTAQKEPLINALFDAASPTMTYGRRASTCAGLVWGYYGGSVLLAGLPTLIANGTITLSASAVNYVYADSAGVVHKTTTAPASWPGPLAAGAFALYTVTVGTSTITSWVDLRAPGMGTLPTSVTSINITPPAAGITVSGGPVTTSGSLTLALADDLAAIEALTGTGLARRTGANAWVAGGLVVTAEITGQAVTYSKIQNVSATDKILGRSTAGAGTVEEITCTAAGRALIDDADAPAQRTTLGLGTSAVLDSDTDGTLTANSDTKLATQKAVKTYVDTIVSGGATDVMVFKGAIDCSANPNYPAADAGNLYKISVAGKIGGASGTVVEAGDTIYCITDSTGSGTQASVGANWVASQANIDGAVIGPASSVDSRVVMFNGSTGKLIKDSGLTLSGTNTGDQSTITGNAGTATALQTARNIDGVSFDGTSNITVLAPATHAATSKATPVDADELPLADSAASFLLKKLTWANLKATVFSAWGQLIASGTAKSTPVNADGFAIMDSAASNATKTLSFTDMKAFLKTYFDTLYGTVSQPFDLIGFYPGVPTASAKVLRVPAARAITFPANFSGSYATASAAATASTAFDVQKNGTTIGTITFAIAATTGTFTTTSGTSKAFAAGDVLMIVSPGTADATLADIGITLTGTR